jgi:uncharacterized membrane protein YidH (DUF202 family)
MERGTDWERERVRQRWSALERKRSATTRLLASICLAGGGLLLLSLAAARGVCFMTARGAVSTCTPTTSLPVAGLLALIGALALGAGLWRWRHTARA